MMWELSIWSQEARILAVLSTPKQWGRTKFKEKGKEEEQGRNMNNVGTILSSRKTKRTGIEEVKGKLILREGGNGLCRFPQILMRMSLETSCLDLVIGSPWLVVGFSDWQEG